MSRLLEGKYGRIQKKHTDLAKVVVSKQPELDSITDLLAYASDKSKYKNWTFRDFDKALAVSTTLSIN